jgi:D-arabinose 1-dehydrogenase-like Zn-dependent alcohol dehydrogenase
VHLHDTHFDLGKGKILPAGQPGMTLGHEIAGTVAAVVRDMAWLSEGCLQGKGREQNEAGGESCRGA